MFPISLRGISFELTDKGLHVGEEVLPANWSVSIAADLKLQNLH